ncbi:MAG: UDP-N-acetylglucosamine--N-acetylmuramyl-(pentapeptide) pyrophosphoryl-undecaprenol N-acetylglucosamine transferase [Patescibacteria group bacterium]
MLRILFTGGGTGGHIYPILAVVEQLKKKAQEKKIELDLYYLGAPENYGKLLTANNIKVSKVASAKLRRYFDLRNIIAVPKLVFSLFQALWKVFFIMPDVLLSKGGTGALPVVWVCKFYRIPIIIHESDSVAGLTNLISSKYAQKIGISFALAQESFVNYFKKPLLKQQVAEKIALIGNPIRNFLFVQEDDLNQEAAKKISGFDAQKPLLLVMGGSSGSVRVNDFFLGVANDLISGGFQVLHQTGLKNFQEFNKELNVSLDNLGTQKTSYKTVPYFEENIKDAYIAADMIISRAGSGSIFEIAAMGKPSLLIPLADSASDHQKQNAYEYAKTGATIVIEELNLKESILVNQLETLFKNSEKLKQMGQAAKNFSKPGAAGALAEEIFMLSGNK